MHAKMVCLEDGIFCCGFRKMAAWVTGLNPNTQTHYISTEHWATIFKAITGQVGAGGDLDADSIDELAQGLAVADFVGFSSE